MTAYEIPEDRLPRPALPTADEARAAIDRTITEVVGDDWKPIIRQAVGDLIFTGLIGPLLESGLTWQGRAVYRREQFHTLAARWSSVRDLVLGIATPDEAQQLLRSQIASMYEADGSLPGIAEGFGLYAILGLIDLDKLTPEQVDLLHIHRAHPRYEYETTEGQRKAWENEMTPPWDAELGRPGDGWELNKTSENGEAWERFDYTEERYWRRRKPVPSEKSTEGEV